tara:strand:+ start:393 stop:1829 length:1437 start_codon:yes stop_codon:yes gene_type:complete
VILFYIIITSLIQGEVSDGYTLFSPLPNQNTSGTNTTYLIDNSENIINTWSHDCTPVTISYILPDSSIVVPCTQSEVDGLGGGGLAGGRILKLSWDGIVLWDDIFAQSHFQPHHDIEPLPNGNILFISYERKTLEEALSLGRESVTDEIWPSYIIELEQVGLDSSRIVWEWHLWDHTVQDIYPNLENYGIIADNPGKIDINLGSLGGGGGASGDWIHLNSIDYNEELDLIAISSRKMNEFYFIDHSTTIVEAASDTGGNFNVGGQILYRWGNPENYNRGNDSDQILLSQHSVNWIDSDFPGGGDIILFNNRTEELGSEILQINVPVDDFNYQINSAQPHEPNSYTWRYGDGSFWAGIQSGAFRLENGNTLISIGDRAEFFEINQNLSVVWEYEFTGPSGQDFLGKIARAQKYSPSYFNSSILGDFNSDAIIDILDVILALEIVLNQEDGLHQVSIDLNYDGNGDIFDLIILISIILQN